MRRRFSHTLVLTAVSIMAASAAATQGIDEPLATFFAPVDVPLVSVEVYVFGKDGRPVPGLTLEDFEVFEDGKVVEASHFYASPSVAAPVGDNQQPSETELEETGFAQDLYLVVYFDDTNLGRGRRQAAVQHLRTFLSDDLPPDLRVMLVRYDGRNHVEQDFTEETEDVLSALEAMHRAASLSRQTDETKLMRDIQNATSMASSSGNRAQEILEYTGRTIWESINTFVEQTVHRTRTSIENQERIISSLSGLSGRKAILLVTDGVEPRPGEALYHAWSQVFGVVPAFRVDAQRAFLQANRNDLSNEFDELAQFANGHRVSFYILSSAGSGIARAYGVETGRLDEQRFARDQAMSAEVLITHMADITGGRPLVNSTALASQLDDVAEELASYYSLAFEPHHLGDGKYHRLEVKVKRDGVRVRHRQGYLDLPLDKRLDQRTLAAAIHGVTNNPLEISVATVGETLRRDDGTFLVPVIVTVPIGQLVLIPSEEEHRGQISIDLLVRDQRGDLSPIVRREYPVAIPNALLSTALGKTAAYTMRLAARPGRQRIAVGLRDEIAQAESVTFLEVNVGDTGGLDD